MGGSTIGRGDVAKRFLQAVSLGRAWCPKGGGSRKVHGAFVAHPLVLER